MKIAITFLLLSSIASAAEVFLVRTDGVYKREVAFPPGSIVIGIGDTPPPTGGTVRQKVAALSKSLLTGTQAAPIAAIVKGMIGSSTPRASLDSAINQFAGLDLFPNNKIMQWYAGVSVLQEGEYTTAFMGEVVAGITDAFTPAGGRVDIGEAFDFALILKIITCIIGELPAEADEEAKALNFMLIMKIITCIIGNLPGDAVVGEGVPTLAPRPDSRMSWADNPILLDKVHFKSVLLSHASDMRIRSTAQQAALMELAKTRGLVGSR